MVGESGRYTEAPHGVPPHCNVFILEVRANLQKLELCTQFSMNSPGVILSKKYCGHTQRHDVKQCELPLLLSDNSQHLRMDT